jgi:hypothetical protein
MDKLTFCNNYLYSCGQVIFIFLDKLYLLYDVCFVSEDMCVEMEAMRWIELTCQ